MSRLDANSGSIGSTNTVVRSLYRPMECRLLPATVRIQIAWPITAFRDADFKINLKMIDLRFASFEKGARTSDTVL